jgi:hypothetical protein
LSEDNQNELFFPAEQTDHPAPAPFAPEQMVRCDECLRANPPTRVNCLYCAAILPLTDATVKLQKPSLRPLEKWEQGYNNILLPLAAAERPDLHDGALNDAASLLRLAVDDLKQILATTMSLPLARAATRDEAELIQRRLLGLGIETTIFAEAARETRLPVKVRALEIADTRLVAFQTPDVPGIEIPWSTIVLIIAARLIVKRVELKEQTAAGVENRILDASEFATDETVCEFFCDGNPRPYRIAAHSFDFSCLGANKGLVASENLASVIKLLCEHTPRAEYDDRYNSVRKSLEAVWPSERQNATTGWRRERPGKYSVGSVTELSNETQFQRYSQLRYHLLREKTDQGADD